MEDGLQSKSSHTAIPQELVENEGILPDLVFLRRIFCPRNRHFNRLTVNQWDIDPSPSSFSSLSVCKHTGFLKPQKQMSLKPPKKTKRPKKVKPSKIPKSPKAPKSPKKPKKPKSPPKVHSHKLNPIKF